MRKFAIRSADSASSGSHASKDDGKGWFVGHWRLLTLLAIILMAFLIRFVFAYGISAGDNYALSGGTSATNHLHVVESILTGSFALTDPAFAYPYGSVNVVPPLFDFVMAGVAGLGTLFGISTTTAAAGALAWTAPIFAALTCYPVYLIGKKMFNDEKTGILSALFYAFFALLIMETAFSNGTEYAFAGFLAAWMFYFMLKAVSACESPAEGGIKANKSVLVNALIAGILFGALALSWNEYRIILCVMVVLMAAQLLLDRFKVRDMGLNFIAYAVTILVGTVIAACYYLPAGLWDQVFSGPCIIAVVSVVLCLLYVATSKISWVLMLPITVIIAIAVFAAMFFVAPDMFSSVFDGLDIYKGSLMQSLTESSNLTISNLASYFGWLVVWFPLVMFLYMGYKFRKNSDSRIYLFTMMWMISMFVISWFSAAYAFFAASAFAVAGAAALMIIFKFTDLRSYFHSLRGNGVRGAFKKAFKPIPLIVTVGLVALILVPNAVYAVDAATPTNSESGDDYFGGLGYTIQTDDSDMTDTLWKSFNDIDKSGALATWLGFSSNAVCRGDFDVITDNYGAGASAVSQILLGDGSAGATAAMVVYLLMANNVADFKSDIEAAGLDYGLIAGYINDPCSAIDAVIENVAEYGQINTDLTCENAVYFAVGTELNSIPEADLDELYSKICTRSGEAVSYVMVTGSMLPMYYNDGTYFSTLAYFADYYLDGYGAATEFFTVSTSTGYDTYLDAMYDTFLWKSLIGITQTDAGVTSTTALLNALALSDGTVKAQPGLGLSNYSISYWHVQYNADDEATVDSAGWEDMDAYEAMALQAENGGVINYLSGVVMLEYEFSENVTLDGTVTYEDVDGQTAASGIQVAVFVEETIYGDVKEYVQHYTAYTDANGYFKLSIPSGADYYVNFSTGTTSFTGGMLLASYSNEVPSAVELFATSVSGSVVVEENIGYDGAIYVVIVGTASGYTAQSDAPDGRFQFNNIIPDLYTVTVYQPNGTTLLTSTMTVYEGNNTGAQITANVGTITVTVTDQYGASIDYGKVLATDASTGVVFSADIEDGKAVLSVTPSTFNISATDGVLAYATTSVTVTASSSKTATLSVYDSKTVVVDGLVAGTAVTLSAIGFSTTAVADSTGIAYFEIPSVGATQNEYYTAYSISGGRVYTGCGTDSITVASSDAYAVNGNILGVDGEATTASVYIISGNYVYSASTDAEGNFKMYLPNGDYVLYIYKSTDVEAIIEEFTVSGADVSLGKMTLDSGRTVAVTLRYRTQMSSSTYKGLAFAAISMKITMDGKEYVMSSLTNTSGRVTFYVPQNYAVEVSTAGFDTAQFHMEAKSNSYDAGTTNQSVSWTLGASSEADADAYVKYVSVTAPCSAELELYSSSTTKYTVGATAVQIMPGQYTVTVLGSTGQYYDGTIYVYPGQNGALQFDVVDVITMTVTASTTDEVTVTAFDEGTYYQDEDDEMIYYLQKGESFYVKATSGSGSSATIAYGSVMNASANVTVDLSNKASSAEITGYVGAAADGTLTVNYGNVTLPFDITDGVFTMVVPAGNALSVSAEVSVEDSTNNVTYTFKESATMAAENVKDGAKFNFYVLSDSVEYGETYLSGSNYSFNAGVGSFDLAIENATEHDTTYILSSGSAWTLDRTYTLNVAAGSTETISVSGHYDPEAVGAGNEDLNVTVTDILGTELGTFTIPSDDVFTATGHTDTFVDIMGTEGAFNDVVNGYEYQFAVTVVNNDNYLKYATVAAVIAGGSSWILCVTDENGYVMDSSGGRFAINGYDSVLIYVKVMCADGSSSAVPGVTINVSIENALVSTHSESGKVVVHGATATLSLTAESVEVESSDMSTSGDGIYDYANSVPALFWVMAALCILMLIAVVWLGMKRGVFTRRK